MSKCLFSTQPVISPPIGLRTLLFLEMDNWTSEFLDIQHFSTFLALQSTHLRDLSCTDIQFLVLCLCSWVSFASFIFLLFMWSLSLHPSFKCLLLLETFLASGLQNTKSSSVFSSLSSALSLALSLLALPCPPSSHLLNASVCCCEAYSGNKIYTLKFRSRNMYFLIIVPGQTPQLIMCDIQIYSSFSLLLYFEATF